MEVAAAERRKHNGLAKKPMQDRLAIDASMPPRNFSGHKVLIKTSSPFFFAKPAKIIPKSKTMGILGHFFVFIKSQTEF